MNDSMIERVARALCLLGNHDPDGRDVLHVPPQPLWIRYAGSAHAAIAAMYHPDENVREAWEREGIDQNVAVEIWQTGVNAALNVDVLTQQTSERGDVNDPI